MISMRGAFLKEYLKLKYKNCILTKPPTSQGAMVRKEILSEYREAALLRETDIEEILQGSIKPPETCFLWDLIVERQPSVVLQIGTFVGVSALIIAEALRFNNKGVLYAVDPEISHRAIKNPVDVCRHLARKRSVDNRIRFIKGWFSNSPDSGPGTGNRSTSEIPVVSQALLEKMDPLDMVFIDGDHSTLCCICDFEAVKNHLSEKGIALFHDSNSWVSVMSAINIISKDETVKESFKIGGFWEGDGIFFMERTSSAGQRVSLELVVRDSVSKMPVNNALIKYKKRVVARTGLNGRASFDYVLSGKYRIDVEANGYQRLKNTPVILSSDKPEQQTSIEILKNL